MSDRAIADEILGIERFTENARKVINQGYDIARVSGYKDYEPIHLFSALLKDENGIVKAIFERLGIDIVSTIQSVDAELLKNSVKQRGVDVLPLFSDLVKKVLYESIAVSSELQTVYVSSEHILLAMLKLDEIDFIKEMKHLNLNYETLKQALMQLRQMEPGLMSGSGAEEVEESQLPFFCTDMTEEAVKGKYSHVYGRDGEINRLIHILSRKTKNNPILVGEAGVGKTAIIEGFANMIRDKKVPGSFFDKRILNLDVASILSGARLRGDVEERILAVVNEAIEDENVILFIDEIHTIVGAGSVGGKDSLDIANILKPYLTGSDLSIIGATTIEEYSKYFEDDSALTRRFQAIMVEELNIDDSISAIQNIKKDFESFHNVKITNDAIKAAVELSSKFIMDRYLPDKAIDIIDESAASVKIGREIAIEPELQKLGEKLIKAQKKKEEMIEKKNFDQAEKFKDEEKLLIDDITEIIEGRKPVKKKYTKSVTEGLIKEVIYNATKIPIVATDISNKKLKGLAESVKQRIVGQNHVVDNVSKAIQRSHLGITNPNKPLASFLFLGPTGVGKTELAKSLAKELFGSKDLIYQVNMSEFMEMHSVSKLIGSPPGYVGHQEGGQLTKYVRKKPYSVILFDELEKAHPDSLNILLQILEEGELTDGLGRKVNFKNTIIVMTSNIGAEDVSSDNRLGFDVTVEDKSNDEMDDAFEEMRDKIMERLRLQVRPEFLNRIDAIEVFRGLNKKDSLEISRIELEELKVRLLSNRILLEFDDSVIAKVNEEGYSKEFGGRNIRRKVQELVENGLTTYLLTHEISKSNAMLTITVKEKGGELVFNRKG